MLTRFVALLVLCGALGVLGQDAPQPAAYSFGLEHVALHGRITGIVDGDTINVLIKAKQHIRVRIAFVDAPEKGQPFGQRAKQAMSDVGLELLKQGLCWVYEKYVGEASPEIQSGYRDAQHTAQSEKAGLWQDFDPVPPGNGAKRNVRCRNCNRAGVSAGS